MNTVSVPKVHDCEILYKLSLDIIILQISLKIETLPSNRLNFIT